jgi:hypothetical protein
MKYLKLLSKITLLVLLLSLTGCYYNEVVPESLPPVGNEVSFSLDIQPIFNANCVGCHNGTLNPNLTTGNSYTFLTVTDPTMVIPNNAAGSELYQRINGGGMPPSGSLSTTKINLVKTWINQGALNN